MHFNYLCRWNSPTFLWEVIEGRKSRHLSNLKVIFLRPEQKKVRVIILNERSLEPRMLPWQPKFYKDQTFFLYNFLFLEFQWIRFSNYRVIVNLVTQWSTCKPDDVIIFTVVVVCSEPILSVMFRPFTHRYLWNQIRYQKTVNSIHSCFSCTFIWENKNFRFISTLTYFNKVKFTRNFRSCSKNWIKKQDGKFVAMVTKDLQTFNLEFDQVMFNSLVLTWERSFEVSFGIFSVLVFQINVLESYLDIYLF